jgi:hypothetical protein
MSAEGKKASEREQLRRDVDDLRRVLGTLISWMAQSANAPIRVDEARALLKQLERL